MASLDAVVVGAGPNGLTAAITLAAQGLGVRVYEAAETVGGGARTEGLTLPGFRHDRCSAVHPFAIGSPVLARLPLRRHGLRWLHPPLPLAHPFPDGSAAVLDRSVRATAASLGPDGRRYERLIAPFRGRWDDLAASVLRPQLAAWPAHPLTLGRFGLRSALPPAALAGAFFRGPAARALLAGLAAHAMIPLTSPPGSAIALLLAIAGHEVGWPVAAGGSQAISDALSAHLTELGGEIVTGYEIRSWKELPDARAVFFDTSPGALARIAGSELPARYLRSLARYRYGPGIFKIDYALSGPMPWTAPPARRAGTVHLGPGYQDIAAALRAAKAGSLPEPPFLIAVQPCVADPLRAPAGQHVLWVYGHVPNGWPGDATAAIERQLDRFAPGCRDRVLARRTAGPAEIEARNPGYPGGDIGCGSFDGLQAVARPVPRRVPYATPNPAIYLCSAATPPGPGVHGACGYHAARSAAERTFGMTLQPPSGQPPSGQSPLGQ
ncbi:MAG TPA: NAD(P)/FAD-dependent oxidoreductase [Streptosporangiaceae bacterium]|nr:NAD(P)/FAD-dependent oxidoreductase [Streptosporangiaceae bacterium]